MNTTANDIATLSIEVIKGSVSFPEYDTLKKQALDVATFIRGIDVTEENIKDAKKVLANANKAVKEIEDRRISVKKSMLEPYDIFESKVKEIVSIVKEADTHVRSKVRELEERERQEKQAEIEEEWNKRTGTWEYKGFYTFDDFLDPRHLNKTATMKSIVADIESYIASKTEDLDFLRTSFTDEHLTEYLQSGDDIKVVIKKIEDRKTLRDSVENIEEDDFSPKRKVKTYFIVEDAKDAALAEALLKMNNVNYKKEVK